MSDHSMNNTDFTHTLLKSEQRILLALLASIAANACMIMVLILWTMLPKPLEESILTCDEIACPVPTGRLEVTPLIPPTPAPTPFPEIVLEEVTICDASWYSQHNLIATRKEIAGTTYGAASGQFPLGTPLTICVHGTNRCIDIIVNDFCAGCGTIYPTRCLDLQKEAFAELVPLTYGVAPVTVYKKVW